jgi:hypothetical protein
MYLDREEAHMGASGSGGARMSGTLRYGGVRRPNHGRQGTVHP